MRIIENTTSFQIEVSDHVPLRLLSIDRLPGYLSHNLILDLDSGDARIRETGYPIGSGGFAVDRQGEQIIVTSSSGRIVLERSV